MAFTFPVIADFKAQFFRDFPFAKVEGANPGTNRAAVMDQDITNALTAAGMNTNVELWSTQAEYTYASNLAAAHFLVTNLLAAAQGLRGQGEWLVQAKSVDQISTTYAIPERILNSPTLAQFSKTTYGMQYLHLLAPRLVGNVMAIWRQVSVP